MKDDEKNLARVAPSVPCVAPAGSTAEQQTGEVIADERPDLWSYEGERHGRHDVSICLGGFDTNSIVQALRQARAATWVTYCPDCDKGIRGGFPCDTCGGLGTVHVTLTQPRSAPAVARTDGIVAGHPRALEDPSSLSTPAAPHPARTEEDA